MRGEFRRYGGVGCILTVLLLSGCVQIPRKVPTADFGSEELSASVHLLAQPAMEGRKPNSLGSWRARKYIEARFRNCGLKPWGRCSGFGQGFLIGTNVVGVLPGSDPARRDQIVLISAHYDHLGKDYPGAADNGAGVAALLELVEHFSQRPDRPGRTLAFAAFDAEETALLGTFVFTCRKDFDPARLAAVVNLDILGRDFFDVTRDALLVVGTERYPRIRARVAASARAQGLSMCPIGTDLAGLTGDHVAFELMNVPCLFFSDGYYRDYHQPTDTADKINYAKLERETRVVADTVAWLADGKKPETAVPVTEGDREELLAIRSLLAQVCARHDEAGLKPADREALAGVAREVEVCLARPRYTPADRRVLLWQLAGTILPMTVFRIADIEVPPSTAVKDLDGHKKRVIKFMGLSIADFSARHRPFLIRTMQQGIRYSLDHKLEFLFGRPAFNVEAYDVADSGIVITGVGEGTERLSVMFPKITITGGRNMGFDFTQSFDVVGGRGDMIDFCLLKWRTNAGNPSFAAAWRKILVVVAREDRGETFEAWLRWRLAAGGFANASEWHLSLLKSRSPRVVTEALVQVSEGTPPGMRKPFLRALVELLSEDRLYVDTGDGVFWDPSYPFYDYPEAAMIRSMFDMMGLTPSVLHGPVSDMARVTLTGLTGQDFGKDPSAWRTWIAESPPDVR